MGARLMFTTENEKECVQITERYLNMSDTARIPHQGCTIDGKPGFYTWSFERGLFETAVFTILKYISV